MNKAVILARGLGTRMRKADDSATMSEEEAKIAATGVKALIPIDRPFLDYVLHSLAEAGYSSVCLVIGPEHDAIREYYGKLSCKRIRIQFAIQEKPLGTADAVKSAEKFAAGEPVLVINSDNYYPVEAFVGLRKLTTSGLAGFDRDAMLKGNIPADRVTKFAVIQTDSSGKMTKILEKPDEQTLATLRPPIQLSMNCWRFGPSIYEACKKISPSPRGEYEIPDAVSYAMMELGETFQVVPVADAVLDLSSRSDIASVKNILTGSEVRL